MFTELSRFNQPVPSELVDWAQVNSAALSDDVAKFKSILMEDGFVRVLVNSDGQFTVCWPAVATGGGMSMKLLSLTLAMTCFECRAEFGRCSRNYSSG